MIAILYVDDETTLLDVTKMYLERTGEFTVDTCTSAQDGIGKLDAHFYDAVISDYQMPEMDGIAFLKYLRPRYSTLPFILFTGKGREEVAIEALNSGADFYLQKGGEPKNQFAELQNKILQAVKRRRAEAALYESEEKYRDLVENINDVLFTVDTAGTITYISPRISQMGYTPDQVIGKHLREFLLPDNEYDLQKRFDEAKQGIIKPCEFRHRDTAGKMHWIRSSSRPFFQGEQFLGLQGILTDITDQKNMQDALCISEEHYRGIFDNAPIGIFHATPEGKILDVNPVYARMFGYGSADEVIDIVNRTGVAEALYADPTKRTGFVRKTTESHDWHTFENAYRRKDGSTFVGLLSFRSYRNAASGREELEGFVLDLSATKNAEARVNEVARKYRNVFDAAGDAMLVLDCDTGAILDANPAAVRMYGYTSEELKGLVHRNLFAKPETRDVPENSADPFPPLFRYRKKDGTIFDAETISSRYPQKKRTICIVSVRDITERKKAEEGILAAQRLYAVLSRINQAILHVKDLATLVDEICRISVESGRFRMSWVGLLDRESGTFRPVAYAGEETGFLALAGVRLQDDERGRGPTGTALREGRYDVCNDIETDPRMEPWREEALKRGYRSSAAFPFRLHGEVVGAYTIYASEKDFFNQAEITLLEEIAQNISFALDMLDEQAKRSRAETALAGSEERAAFFAEVLENSSQPFGVRLPDGRFGSANTALCTLLGYTEEELRGMTWTGVTAPGYSEQETATLQELLQAGTPVRYEKECVRKDGTRVPVEMFVHRVVDSGGSIQYFYAFVTDISERRMAGETIRKERDQTRQYLNIAGVMLCIMDRSGTVTLINRKGCEILGYPEEEILGRNWVDSFVPGEAREEVRRVIGQILDTGTGPYEYHENAVLTGTGERRIVAFHNTVLTDADSHITGILFSGEDITSRNQVLIELRDAKDTWQAIFSAIGNPTLILGPDQMILEANDAVIRMTGKTMDELRLMRCFEIFHPPGASGPPEGCPFEQVKRSGRLETGMMEVEAFGGTYLVSCTPVCNGQGELAKMLHIATEITDLRRAEEALQESGERYRTIFEASGDAIFLIDDVFADANPEAGRMLGYSRDEILGHGPGDISPEVQPDGRQSRDTYAEYIRAAREGSAQVFPWVHRKKDGVLIDTEVSLRAVAAGGESRVIAIIRNVTDLHRAEQQVRRLATFPEVNPEPVVEITLEKEIIYANPASYRILRQREMPADPAAFLPGDIDAIIRAIRDGEYTIAAREVPAGSGVFSETIAYSPEFSSIRIYAHDITDMVRAASAFEQANRKLNLLSSITRHDIRNKLTGVLGYLELSRGSTTDPALLDFLQRAETSANAVRHQIEFTKEYENLGIRAPTWQDLSRIIEDTKKELELGTIIVDDETDGLSLYADPMLPKVIYNLMENSIRHGGHVTRIRFLVQISAEGCTIRYEDDGVGVAYEMKEKIFNRMTRSNAGIGLFLVREILGITGITITETGEPGRGARFEIFISQGRFHLKPPE